MHTAKMMHPGKPGEIKEVAEADLVPYMVAGWQQVKEPSAAAAAPPTEPEPAPQS